MTCATSSGSATWIRLGCCATRFRTASVTHPVSVTGGCTTLAVIPSGASSARQAAIRTRRSPKAAPAPGLHRADRQGQPLRRLQCGIAAMIRQQDAAPLRHLKRLHAAQDTRQLPVGLCLGSGIVAAQPPVGLGRPRHLVAAEGGAAPQVQGPVADDVDHPGHQSAQCRVAATGMAPDVHEGVLQRFLRPAVPPQ